MQELRPGSNPPGKPTRVIFRKLSGAGHDEWEKADASEIQREFEQLMKNGYALFVNEQQAHSLAEAEAAWAELVGAGSEAPMYVTAVPALRGGSN